MGILATVILSIIVFIVGIVILWVIFWWFYQRASKEVAFVRTGLGGQKVVQNGGAFVIPVLHDVIRMTMGTNRFEISRQDQNSVITRDRLRVDVTAEFYVRVGGNPKSIALAAQSLGSKTARPEAMRDLLEGRFVDALRTAAAEMTIEALHEQRGEYIRQVKNLVSPNIEQTGLELESVSLTDLHQTDREFFNPNNAFDAEGLTRLTADIEERRLKRNAIEQDSEVKIRQKNLETETLKLNLMKEEEYARLAQQEEILIRRAQQAASITAEEVARRQEAEEAKVSAELNISVANVRADRQRELERLNSQKEVERENFRTRQEIEFTSLETDLALKLRQIDQEKQIASQRAEQAAKIVQIEAAKKRESDEVSIRAALEVDVMRIESERDLELERVRASENLEVEKSKQKTAVTQADMAAKLAVDVRYIEDQKSLAETEHKKDIAIAESAKAQIKALVEVEAARKSLVKAEEELALTRAKEREEREKVIALIKANTEAEKDTIAMLVLAEARFREAQDLARVSEIETASKTAHIKAIAEAEALAEKARVEADEIRNTVDAKAIRELTDAENTMSEELMTLKLRLSIIDHLKEIIRESVRPMDNIDDIKIVQVDGLMGGKASSDGRSTEFAQTGESGGSPSLPDQVVDSALRYRAQAPVVDSLLNEIGITSLNTKGVGDLLKKNMSTERRNSENDEGEQGG